MWDSPSRPIDLGRRRRFYTGATRRAVELRDRTCAHPGCGVPAERCHIHHNIPHEHGGETTVANGDAHHRHQHHHHTPPHHPRRGPRRSGDDDEDDGSDER